MRRLLLPFVLAALALAPPAARAEPTAAGAHAVGVEMPRDEITPAQREAIWAELHAAESRLALPKAGSRPTFQWPLRASRGYSAPFFESISNFVDHDATFPNKLLDYNCGARTYDLSSGYNHQGTDIALWPDGWNLMATQEIEIVAAAPGTILSKFDGNFDQNCAFGVGDWNAVYIQHDDGSIAWYGHMKKGSPTRKNVGERVAVGEYLGNVGSSGNSTGPHLHFEVYDASGKLIDPFAGQCNGFNAESWWASQQPYNVTHVNRVLTASAAPVFSTCGSDGHMSNPGTFSEKTAFRPGDPIFFVATVRDVQAGQSVQFTIRRPDGSIWKTLDGGAITETFNSAYWYINTNLDAVTPAGTWLLEASLAGTKAQSPFSVTPSGTPPANYTDLWWNSSESGWGVNLIHQGDILFATWFTYDTDGQGMWLVMSNASLQGDGSYSGTIYRTTGTPFDQINGQPAVSGAPPSVGSGTFRFASLNQGTFSYTVNGIAQQKAIQRQAFSTPTSCAFTAGTRAYATNYQDLWWNPAESGWGVNMAHQGDILFLTWFTYRAGGRGQWLVGSSVQRQPTGEFRGTLYRTTGTPFNLINGVPAVTTGLATVGQVTVTFTDGEHARMDYTVDGISQSKTITRQLFAVPAPLCR